MDTQQLRQSLKLKWINYYYANRSWLAKMRIWGEYNGKRRPLSGYILGVLSVLEPELTDMFPFILDLNDNPDDIIEALGLNFNPEENLHIIKSEKQQRTNPLPQPLPRDIETLNPRPVCENGKTNSVPSIVVTAKVESQGQIMPSVAIPTQFIQKNKPAGAVAPNIQAQYNHHNQDIKFSPVNSEISQQNFKQSFTVSNESQNTEEALDISKHHIQEKKIPDEVNQVPITKSNIASWIDEFCQGSASVKEDAVYIHF